VFYSPFDICEVCKEYVLLDQTHEECAREHECGNVKCPLSRFFADPQQRSSARSERTDPEG
jgi:hypothetical protein